MKQTMSHDIENLLPYVKYDVRIQAVNAKGEGNYAEVNNTTLEEGKHLLLVFSLWSEVNNLNHWSMLLVFNLWSEVNNL